MYVPTGAKASDFDEIGTWAQSGSTSVKAD